MDLTKTVYQDMVHNIVNRATGIDIVGTRLGFDLEEGAKSGGTETVIGMITELESVLRVLKRRLQTSLPLVNCQTCGAERQAGVIHSHEPIPSING